MVEEFMLLANVSVAKKIYEHFPEHAVLRKHPVPNPSMFETLTKSATSLVSSTTVRFNMTKEIRMKKAYCCRSLL